MKLSLVKPISYFKANAAGLLDDIAESQEPMAISQNGEVRAVVLDVTTFEKMQDTFALLKLLSLGITDAEQGRKTDMRDALARRRRPLAD